MLGPVFDKGSGNSQHHAATKAVSQSALVALITSAIILILAAAAAFAVARFGRPPDLAGLGALFVARWRGHLAPEPVERTAYLAAVAVAFPAAVLCARWVSKYLGGWGSRDFAAAVSVAAVLLVTWGFSEGSLIRYVFAGDPDGSVGALSVPIAVQVAVAAVLACLVTVRWMRSPARRRRDSGWYVNMFLGLFALGLSATRVRSSGMLYGDIHFEAVFYSVTQVVAGRTLLADLPAQYGLYAELLGPLLKLTGLSVLGFTVLLALLHAASLLALVWFLAMTVRSPFLRLLAGMTILLLAGSTWLHIWHGPIGYEYFQLWPLRLLFPTIVVLAFVFVHRKGMQSHHIAWLALLAGVGLVWNFDWALPAYGALVAYFLVRLISGVRESRRREASRLAVVTAVPILACLVFLAYLAVKSGWRLSLADWLKYQGIFYSTGFGMLPLPVTVHPWMIVVGVYLCGLAHGVTMRMRGRGDLGSDVMLVLSVLGIGIFTYYQGRSHVVVLTFVLWPAILIAFIIADRIRRARELLRVPPLIEWTSLPILVFGILSSFTMIASVPRLLDAASTVFGGIGDMDTTIPQVNAAFIRERTTGASSAVILASGQSVLFAETGLASAVAGPGIVEMLLLKDQEELLATLLGAEQPHLFIEAKQGEVPEPYRPLLERYRIVDRSDVGLLYLQPRTIAP